MRYPEGPPAKLSTAGKLPAVPRFGAVAKRRIQLEHVRSGLREHMANQRLLASYDAASPDRLVRTRTGLGGTGDSHIYTAAQANTMRENARDAIRNHPVLGQMVRRFGDNVQGTGLVIDPETKSPAWNKKAQRLWEAYCDDPSQCDIAKRRTLDQLERLILTGATVDGDMFAVIDDTGRVRLVEGEHVSGTQEAIADITNAAGEVTKPGRNGVILGVELDRDTGEQVAFHFRKQNHVTDTRRRYTRVTDSLSEGDPNHIRIETRNAKGMAQVIQILNDDYRASANRGVTFLAPVFSRASAYDDTEWAQLVQQQIAACVAVFISQEFPTGLGAQSTETIDGFAAALEELTPGLVYRGQPGDKFTAVEPKGPGQDSMKQLMHVVREIGLQLDMPLSLAMLVTSDTTFHGYRGELQQARKSFERRQKWFGRAFRGEIYKRKIQDWIDEGKLADRKDKFAFRIQGPAWPYVDPSKDAQADEVRLKTGAISQRRMHRERGQDWDKLSVEIVEDNEQLIMNALDGVERIKAKHPDAEVHWRDLAHRDAPVGVPQTVNQSLPDGEPGGPTDDTPPSSSAAGSPEGPTDGDK